MSYKVSLIVFSDAEWVGNPVRESIAQLVEPKERIAKHDVIRILVLGGSLGAKALNTVVPKALSLLTEDMPLDIKHQCGEKHLEDCQQNYQSTGLKAELMPFIDDMAAAYGWADLIICRAGALTLAEVSAAGVATVLVPYPYAVDDHQTHNAGSLVKAGAAKLIQESDLSEQVLASEIQRIASDKNQLITMAEAARRQAKPEAANTIADICMAVTDG